MPAENDAKATLTYPGGEHIMSIAKATDGNDGIELGKLLAETGYTTLDGGFVNTASTKSAITYIDGA
ncbi:MAG: citrate (Si)-synthase, partial [Rhodococcus sp. (in: high G+C Gram-positive bacteria)]